MSNGSAHSATTSPRDEAVELHGRRRRRRRRTRRPARAARRWPGRRARRRSPPCCGSSSRATTAAARPPAAMLRHRRAVDAALAEQAAGRGEDLVGRVADDRSRVGREATGAPSGDRASRSFGHGRSYRRVERGRSVFRRCEHAPRCLRSRRAVRIGRVSMRHRNGCDARSDGPRADDGQPARPRSTTPGPGRRGRADAAARSRRRRRRRRCPPGVAAADVLWDETDRRRRLRQPRGSPAARVLRLADADGDACVHLARAQRRPTGRAAQRRRHRQGAVAGVPRRRAPLLLSDMGRVLMTIVADTQRPPRPPVRVRRRATVDDGPLRRRGRRTAPTPNARDLLALGAAKHGLDAARPRRRASTCSSRRASSATTGRCASTAHRRPGTAVELRAEMDVLVLARQRPAPARRPAGLHRHRRCACTAWHADARRDPGDPLADVDARAAAGVREHRRPRWPGCGR